MIEGFEHIELGAGLVQIRGHGASLPAAFAQTALGVLAAAAGRAAPGGEERREVRAHGRSLDELLAAWIGECLYVHEIEGWVPERIEFASFITAAGPGGEALRLHAFVHGREVPAEEQAKAGPPPLVRQATVRPTSDGFEAAVVLDAFSAGT